MVEQSEKEKEKEEHYRNWFMVFHLTGSTVLTDFSQEKKNYNFTEK